MVRMVAGFAVQVAQTAGETAWYMPRHNSRAGAFQPERLEYPVPWPYQSWTGGFVSLPWAIDRASHHWHLIPGQPGQVWPVAGIAGILIARHCWFHRIYCD